MSKKQYNCHLCGKGFESKYDSVEEEMKAYMDKFGPVIATMDVGKPVCAVCERKLLKYMTPELIERAKNELFNKKTN